MYIRYTVECDVCKNKAEVLVTQDNEAELSYCPFCGDLLNNNDDEEEDYDNSGD